MEVGREVMPIFIGLLLSLGTVCLAAWVVEERPFCFNRRLEVVVFVGLWLFFTAKLLPLWT